MRDKVQEKVDDFEGEASVLDLINATSNAIKDIWEEIEKIKEGKENVNKRT